LWWQVLACLTMRSINPKNEDPMKAFFFLKKLLKWGSGEFWRGARIWVSNANRADAVQG